MNGRAVRASRSRDQFGLAAKPREPKFDGESWGLREVRLWHNAEERACSINVRFSADSGRRAEVIVTAAGPYVVEVAALLGETLPVSNVFQQKIAFEDIQGVISRQMPFSIDLDGQVIGWSDEEKSLLVGDPATRWLTEPMPGAIHCCPEGGEHGTWVKLGWAYNTRSSAPVSDPPIDPDFPEIVLRGASRLNPALRVYYGRLPSRMSHFGGYYTMTRENWPLIGPMAIKDAYVAGALSGYGTMAACATGALCAAWVLRTPLPDFARALSLARYDDKSLMQRLLSATSTGVL